MTFSKTGWLTISKSVQTSDFGTSKEATVNTTMVNASAKIIGTITDSKNGGATLEGATISVSVSGTAPSGVDGKYVIENLVEANYTVTFTKANNVTLTRPVTTVDFVACVLTLNVTMGSQELLHGLTADYLLTADKWYYNEYRGGRNADAYPHWDWACDYMSTLDTQKP